jgi:hypothetical protein
MYPVKFEPAVAVTERSQTHALDRATTGIGNEFLRGETLQIFVTIHSKTVISPSNMQKVTRSGNEKRKSDLS